MMTIATAVMNPRKSARLSTTSMKPSLKNPSKNDINPALKGNNQEDRRVYWKADIPEV
jgi:hypothetical protein